MNSKEIETSYETLKHIKKVAEYLSVISIKLIERAQEHDWSKLEEPELSIFTEYTSKLANTIYGSVGYNKYLKEMKVALDHHYSNNRHHPEYFENGINDMTLIDLIEMLCDWYAATQRHNDGDIFKSIEFNKTRFNMSDQLVSILTNTVNELIKQEQE